MISIYADDVLARHARPQETAARLERVIRSPIGRMTLLQLGCSPRKVRDDYVAHRGHMQAARRELEDLRAAVNHHYNEGLASNPTPVMLPERSTPRERWLTRGEAARLLWAAWKLNQTWKGQLSARPVAQHVARFILMGLYTGTRSAAICGAMLKPTVGKGFIDLDHGVFYRRAHGKQLTKKRQPPVRLPPRLYAHLRRWKRLGLAVNAVVEWNGEPVTRIVKAFRSVRKAAGLGADVTPHTLRHTCATWLAQSGAPTWESAGFLGMTEEMFERIYGHHHPDHQSGAVNALSGPRQKKAAPSNVVKLDRRA